MAQRPASGHVREVVDDGTVLESLAAWWERAPRARNLGPKTVTVYGESAGQLTAWLAG
jgi:hypothetical protein